MHIRVFLYQCGEIQLCDDLSVLIVAQLLAKRQGVAEKIVVVLADRPFDIILGKLSVVMRQESGERINIMGNFGANVNNPRSLL
jgi:hypothetical protein